MFLCNVIAMAVMAITVVMVSKEALAQNEYHLP